MRKAMPRVLWFVLVVLLHSGAALLLLTVRRRDAELELLVPVGLLIEPGTPRASRSPGARAWNPAAKRSTPVLRPELPWNASVQVPSPAAVAAPQRSAGDAGQTAAAQTPRLLDLEQSRHAIISAQVRAGQPPPVGYRPAASGAMPTAPTPIQRPKAFAWSAEPRRLFKKNKVGNISIEDHTVLIHLGNDRCLIADLIAFTCRVGALPQANGALFDDLRAHLDQRVTDPLP